MFISRSVFSHSDHLMALPLILFGVLFYTTGTLSMKTLDRVPVRAGGTITIPCLYENKFKLHSKYWCKGSAWFSCTAIAHVNHTGKWTITDYPDYNIFTVKLNTSTLSDSAYYWCAVKIPSSGDDKKWLNLIVQQDPDVSVMNSSVSGHEGDDVSVQCFYSHRYQNELKRWCRFKDQSCYTVGRTDTSQNSSVQISDDGKTSFTVLMTGLRLTDSGWFWCSVGDLQVPVHLTVQKGNGFKNGSGSEKPSDDTGPSSFSNSSTCENHSNATGVDNCALDKRPDPKNGIFLLIWIAVPLLLILMLVLVIWRIIQKHNFSSQRPDVCSVTEGLVTYDTVVFSKKKDHEQNSGSRPPDQDEVIYSTVKHH